MLLLSKIWTRKCGRCGEEKCKDECTTERSEPKCIHCKGNHYAGASVCPKRRREESVNKIRVGKGISYAEAVKRMEGGNERVEERHEERTKRAEQAIFMDRKQFLAFIAMVVNCAMEIKGKTERIKMILDAARRFLKIEDISGEDLDNLLREGFAPTQDAGSGDRMD